MWKLIFAALVLLLGGCVSRGPIAASPNIQLTDLTDLPEPMIAPRVIGPLEQLDITVVNSDILTGKYLTDSEARLDFPLVGTIDAAGLSPNQLADALKRRLSGNYLINPQVRVIPATLTPPTLAVGGEVKNPGTFQASQSPTLLRAIYNAGGFTEISDVKEVIVQRDVDGKQYIGLFNVQAIERGNIQDPRVFAGDVIAVGDSPAKRNLQTIFGAIPILTSLSLIITRF